MRRVSRLPAWLALAIALALPAGAADSPQRGVVLDPGPGYPAKSRFDERKPLDWGISKPLPDDACVKPKYLAKVLERFNWVQKKTWETSVRMIAIREAHEVDFKLHGPETMVDKVYCRGKADIIDLAAPNARPKVHMVAFIVEEDGGFAGVVPGIEWCVAGYDWFRQYEPSCRVLNPY